MKPGKRFGLSAIEKSDVWRRWKAGETLHEIGRAFDKPHASIRCLLLPRGGIPPTARRRSRLALTRSEREDISRGIASGSSIREIARHLDRAASTVGREVTRHGGRPAYRAHEADDQAWESALRPKKCLLALHRRLRDVVASKLILEWSPEQISGWLKTEYPKDERMRVSHETIYRSLFIQARGVLKKELMGHLRTKRRTAHEGTHVSDYENYELNPATAMSQFQFEYRGYQTSAFAASALNLPSSSFKYDGATYPIWNGSWAAVDRNITNFVTRFHDNNGQQTAPETIPHNPQPN